MKSGYQELQFGETQKKDFQLIVIGEGLWCWLQQEEKVKATSFPKVQHLQ